MSILSQLKPPAGAKRRANRVGRGPGSGNGKTCGKGQKGQKSRSGGGVRPYFEGGQMPLMRRLPKRGFHNVHASKVANVNVSDLERFDSGTEVTIASLRAAGLIKGKFDFLKVLGKGELTKKLVVKAHSFSVGAAAKIAKAGGSTEVVPRRVPKTTGAKPESNDEQAAS
ncbi:MAG TPA: 50S ribosomal protein L15 [Sorangium sp.]|nr:50S ribosomal protein L15 [Sorangium sp.]